MKIAIVGGGAAGMMASGYASSLGADVFLFEKNPKLGKKLMITGKGRCNLTNNTSVNEVIENVTKNNRFLYSAINYFTPSDTMSFFEDLGVPLKTERGNRVFPVSDKASDIVKALEKYVRNNNVKVINEKVTDILCKGQSVVGVSAAGREYSFDRVILATGGFSYPLTGSDGDGYRISQRLGIPVTPVSPSLVPLETVEDWCSALQGLSLKNVSLKAYDVNKPEKILYNDFGEMMFTHFGVTGPMILSLSAHLKSIVPGKYKCSIDLKPALDEERLDRRLLSDFTKYSNRNYSNALADLLPSKMIPVFVRLSGIPEDKKVNSLTRDDRHSILKLLKNFQFTIKRTRPIEEAIITSGGVDVSSISPQTMESKIIKGLYYAGEIIDVDAYTGGFNLQIAFSTARLAANAAVQ
ncbi:MAG: NAD(P)/FAD-dependent oxidoreductase [Clostridia bacterium]|nr:NAD(P)/FAD-dependent oxidoreductase [Clostridia bacterium]